MVSSLILTMYEDCILVWGKMMEEGRQAGRECQAHAPGKHCQAAGSGRGFRTADSGRINKVMQRERKSERENVGRSQAIGSLQRTISSSPR